MGSFKFTWGWSMISLVVLTLALLAALEQPAGLLGLGQPASVILVVWGIGLVSTALHVAYERGVRERLVKSARRGAERETAHRIAEVAAHELAQPLTVVMAYAQWLQRGTANPKDYRYYLEQMVAACHEMSVILRNLYETIRHSRAQAGLTILDEPLPLQEASATDGADERAETPLSAARRAG